MATTQRILRFDNLKREGERIEDPSPTWILKYIDAMDEGHSWFDLYVRKGQEKFDRVLVEYDEDLNRFIVTFEFPKSEFTWQRLVDPEIPDDGTYVECVIGREGGGFEAREYVSKEVAIKAVTEFYFYQYIDDDLAWTPGQLRPKKG